MKWPPFRLLAFLPPAESRRLFPRFPFRWVLHVFSLTRRVIVHCATPCSREGSLYEWWRPCDALSCFFLFLFCSFRTTNPHWCRRPSLQIKATTCLQVVPMSLEWPVDPLARSDFSRSSLPPEVPSGEQQLGAFSSFHTFPLETEYSSSTTAGTTAYNRVGWMWKFRYRRSAMYYLEHQRLGWICFLQMEEQRVQTQISQEAL